MKVFLACLLAVSLLAATAAAQTPCGGISGVSVSVSPSPALQGQQVTVTIANNSAQTIMLPSSCVFTSVHDFDCSGSAVLNLICLSVLTPIAPGSSKSQIWDQTDDLGQQVAPSTYAFNVRYWDSNFTQLEQCCPTVVVQPACDPPTTYGVASPGAGGFHPQLLTSGGLSQIGNASFALEISGGLGSASAMLYLGAGPTAINANWGTFFVNPSPVLFAFPLVLGGTAGTPGVGALTIPVPIANDPLLVGNQGYLQVLIADPASSGDISHTPGLRITICS